MRATSSIASKSSARVPGIARTDRTARAAIRRDPRHWFTGAVPHDTLGTVNVLNLVEGKEAIVESPTGRVARMVVHYAETFIVPAAVGAYTIRPHGPAARTAAPGSRPSSGRRRIEDAFRRVDRSSGDRDRRLSVTGAGTATFAAADRSAGPLVRAAFFAAATARHGSGGLRLRPPASRGASVRSVPMPLPLQHALHRLGNPRLMLGVTLALPLFVSELGVFPGLVGDFPSLGRRKIDARSSSLGKPDRDRLLGRPRAVLALANVVNLLPHKLAGLGRR